MEAAAKRFFTSPLFAVAGASQDTNKFGYKVLSWYTYHSLPATPINPKTSSIAIHGTDHNLATVSSVSELSEPSKTSLSIITPPSVTRKILQDAKKAGVQAVWMQPGTFDEEILEYAVNEFEAAVGGEGGRGGEGWCVLVDGEAAMKTAGRKWEKL